MGKSTTRTFWSIIKDLSIEIPTIQRDYAQGRVTESVNSIREKFIDALIKTLRNEDNKQTLHLDFVYGKEEGKNSQSVINRNKQSLQELLKSISSYADDLDLTFEFNEIKSRNQEDGAALQRLLPLDGQQRLTTLFLLHWYIAKRLNNKVALKTLKKFTYKTRRSSSAFIRSICSEEYMVDFFSSNLKEEMTLQSSFSNTWLRDPTVRGILVVLDYIHSQLNKDTDSSLETYWTKLSETKSIYFDYLDLEDFELSDDLYVKMNARGKHLSDFENFKAWLFNLIETNSNNLGIKDWENENYKFDIEWNDIFWFSKGNNTVDIDNAFLYYFRLSFFADYVLGYVKDEKSEFKTSNNKFYTKDEILSFLEKSDSFDFEKIFSCSEFKKQISKYLQFLDYLRIENQSNNLKLLDDILNKSLYEGEKSTFSFYFDSEKSINVFSEYFFSENILKKK